MKIYSYLLVLVLLQSVLVIAQTGIGTKEPDDSSVLDITSNVKGLLIPRMTAAERDLIKFPANSLILFNTTAQLIEVNTGTKLIPKWVSVGGNVSDSLFSKRLSWGSFLIGDSDNVPQEVQFFGDAFVSDIGEVKIDNTAVISKNLIGYAPGPGKISATDSIIEAIEKLDGNQAGNKVVSITKDYSVLITDQTILCDTEKGSFTIYLPEVSISAGKIYVINKIDLTLNQLFINPPLNVAKEVTVSNLNYPKTFKIQSDGKAWYIIN